MNEEQNTAILEKLIDEDFSLKGSYGSRFINTEEHSSLVIDRQRGIFFFNSRHIVGTPLTYLMEVRGMSFQDSISYLKKLDYADTVVYKINSGEKQDVVVYPQLVEVFYEMGKPSENRKYWYKRGINDSTIDRFRLGFYNGFSTIPIYMDGTFRQFQLRKDATDTEPRQIRPYYKGVGGILFNSDLLKVVDEIFITEGLTDCLRLNQEGIPSVTYTTGAGGWHNEWFKKFLHQKKIYVVFDNDEAGKKGVNKVAENLGVYRTKCYNFSGFGEKYDVVNFFNDGGKKEDLLDLIRNKSRFIFEGEK